MPRRCACGTSQNAGGNGIQAESVWFSKPQECSSLEVSTRGSLLKLRSSSWIQVCLSKQPLMSLGSHLPGMGSRAPPSGRVPSFGLFTLRSPTHEAGLTSHSTWALRTLVFHRKEALL